MAQPYEQKQRTGRRVERAAMKVFARRDYDVIPLAPQNPRVDFEARPRSASRRSGDPIEVQVKGIRRAHGRRFFVSRRDEDYDGVLFVLVVIYPGGRARSWVMPGERVRELRDAARRRYLAAHPHAGPRKRRLPSMVPVDLLGEAGGWDLYVPVLPVTE